MFTTEAKKASQPYWEDSFTHPFVSELKAGNLSPARFRYYLLQDRYYLEHFSKLYHLIAQKSKDAEVARMMAESAEHLAAGELAIRERFFAELTITADEIQTTPVAPTAYHYVSHMYRQLAAGSIPAAVAGMLPCAWLYQEIGTRFVSSGSPHPLYQRWIATYAGEEGAVLVAKQRVLVDRLHAESSAEVQQQMKEAFVISARMEYAFWEMAYTLETWKEGK
ncbi:thiaminase II [Enterococcus hirae]|nr:thiaminase II [Enterococcus hirae]